MYYKKLYGQFLFINNIHGNEKLSSKIRMFMLYSVKGNLDLVRKFTIQFIVR